MIIIPTSFVCCDGQETVAMSEQSQLDSWRKRINCLMINDSCLSRLQTRGREERGGEMKDKGTEEITKPYRI